MEASGCADAALSIPSVWGVSLSTQEVSVVLAANTVQNYLTFQSKLLLDKSSWLYKFKVVTFRSAAKCHNYFSSLI